MEKQKKFIFFFKNFKVAGIESRDKLIIKLLLREEKVATVARFLSRQLILATFSFRNFF